MRFRDDKPHANHITTIRNVIISIDDGVTKEEVSYLYIFSFLIIIGIINIIIIIS